MNKFHTLTVGTNDYQLRLTARSIMDIEKKLNKPLFKAMESIQDNIVETVTTIIWGAMQPLNSGVTIEKTMEIFDEYIDQGNSMEDLMQELNKLFEVSGFFKKGQV